MTKCETKVDSHDNINPGSCSSRFWWIGANDVSKMEIDMLAAICDTAPGENDAPWKEQVRSSLQRLCRVWDTADVKGEEGCCIDGATWSDYIHNQDE
jgi:hypothetical protein